MASDHTMDDFSWLLLLAFAETYAMRTDAGDYAGHPERVVAAVSHGAEFGVKPLDAVAIYGFTPDGQIYERD